MPQQRAHLYDNVQLKDNARAQFGDTIIHNHRQPLPRTDKYETLHASLTFDRMHSRLLNVASALPTTCQWLFDDERLSAWTDTERLTEHHGLLWIKGKPGSGKSTIMKELLEWVKNTSPLRTTLSYFFNARSSDLLEKSSLGLYRSLLHQFLSVSASTRPLFEERFASKENLGKVEPWTEVEIQNFLLELATAKQLSSVNIFVDALDEGQNDDIRRLVTFFERLTQRSCVEHASLWICLSSRHYPHVSTRRGLSIILEDQPGHESDIETYIQSELAMGDDVVLNELSHQLCSRSAGIFLWVVLAVCILNQAYDEGESSTGLLKKLKEVPQDLHDLFNQILFIASKGRSECMKLLTWTLFSMEPLDSQELYCIVHDGCSAVEMVNLIDQEDRLMRYLLHCSGGLIEAVSQSAYKYSSPQLVQFIHETLREHLLHLDAPQFGCTGNITQQSSSPIFSKQSSHSLMAQDCLRYLRGLPSPSSNPDILKRYPFASYAAKYWWLHASATENLDQNLSDLALDFFIDDPENLQTWGALYDVDRLKLGDPGSPDTPKSVLYYAAFTGIPKLVARLLALGHDPNALGGMYGSPLGVSIRSGNEQVVQLLIDAGADVNPTNSLQTPLQIALIKGHISIARILIHAGAHVDTNNFYVSPLEIALREKLDEMVLTLVSASIIFGKDKDKLNRLLQQTSRNGYERGVRLLIDAGADVNSFGGTWGDTKTALWKAAYYGHEQIVQMLIDAGADVDRGGEKSTALWGASIGGNHQVVRALVDAGADIEAPSLGATSLWYAASGATLN